MQDQRVLVRPTEDGKRPGYIAVILRTVRDDLNGIDTATVRRVDDGLVIPFVPMKLIQKLN